MKTTLYILTFSILTAFSLIKSSAKKNTHFILTLSTCNHAEQFSEGILTYSIENNVFTITQSGLISEKTNLLYKKEIDDKVIRQMENINLEKLKDFYFNKCIITTSGNEYFISAEKKDSKKKIQIHHYYIQQIEEIVNEINKLVPKNLKIDYVKSDTKQDCT